MLSCQLYILVHFSEHQPWLLINVFVLCHGVKYHRNISVENQIGGIVKHTLLNPEALMFAFICIMTLEINQLSDYF